MSSIIDILEEELDAGIDEAQVAMEAPPDAAAKPWNVQMAVEGINNNKPFNIVISGTNDQSIVNSLNRAMKAAADVINKKGGLQSLLAKVKEVAKIAFKTKPGDQIKLLSNHDANGNITSWTHTIKQV